MGAGPLATLAAVLLGWTLLQWMLWTLCEAMGLSDGTAGTVLSLYLHVALLCTAGYALVSLNMRRPLAHVLCSRYGGWSELGKLQRLLPWLLLTGLLGVLRTPTTNEEASGHFLSTPTLLFGRSPPSKSASLEAAATAEADTPADAASFFFSLGRSSLQPLPSLPLAFVAAFFLGAHFTFLDGSRVLQSLGCKLPLPSLWPLLTRQEWLIIVCSGVGVVAALAPSLFYLLRDESVGWLLLCVLLLAAVQVYLADMLHTGSGVLVGATASSLPAGAAVGGLEAPMSGKQMWKTKVRQILASVSVQVPACNQPTLPLEDAAPLIALANAPPSVPGASSAPASSSVPSPSSPSLAPPQIFLHVHHYLWGTLLLPLLRFPCLSGQVAAGVLLGLAVEGVACWGMDPLLVCKRPIEPDTAAAAPAAAATRNQSSAATATVVVAQQQQQSLAVSSVPAAGAMSGS
jgi:hypothetical protein